MGLLDKYKELAARHQMMLGMGKDALGLRMDKILSPTRALQGNREILLAGTNNYLGLTLDADCIKAAKEALDVYGTGTTGSRVANGSYGMHMDLEAQFSEFLGRKHTLVFSTGYQANLGTIAGLAGPEDTIFLDADSHASIYDGCRLSGARLVRFRHNDAANLGKRLARAQKDPGGKLVVIEGLYSMFGDTPPLADFVEVKEKYGAMLLVDEAHSFGVLGANGRGLAEQEGLEEEVDVVAGTFSKSLGAVGGFAASNDPLFEMVRLASRPYMFTASPSPATMASVSEALRQIEARPELRENLRRNGEELHVGLKNLGLDLCCDTPGPVVAVQVPNELVAITMWNQLLDDGLYVNIAIPPGTPNATSLLRCSVSAAHSLDDIAQIVEIFQGVAKALAG
ncbi:MAG TPA: aminotransferase class I/II-fold pyridoxal phosphate-dependent enzyme [Rhizobiales bacterium]|nr:aminotransferase class I/II-fold pyridoxal phosphate-dependent enzyme [Hyphomicrobiales bacterium]